MNTAEHGLIGTQTRYFEEEFGKEITKEEFDNIIIEFEKIYDGVPLSPSCYTKTDYILKIPQDEIFGICGLLDWDIGLNQKALDTGKHPITGYISGKHTHNIITRNRRWIKLLGIDPNELGHSSKIDDKKGDNPK